MAGLLDLNNNLEVQDNATVGGSFAVSGTTTLDNTTINNLTVTNNLNLNNTSIGGTLGVTGVTTLSDNLTVSGITSLDNTSINGTLAVTEAATFQDNASVAGTLDVTGATDLNGVLDVAGVATFQDNASVSGALDVTGATDLNGILDVAGVATFQDNASVAGALDVTGATNLNGSLGVTGITTLNDNTTVSGAFTVTGISNLNGNAAIGGNLTLGNLSVAGLTSNLNTDNATIGTVYTDTIMSADGQTGLIRKNSDGTISIGSNTIDFDHTKNVISAREGPLTLGDHDNHVTKVRGILSIQDPTEPDHAATRRYVDQSAAMAAALDTRNPEKGKNFHLQLGGATKNQENALGLNFAGSMFLVNAPGAGGALPFSISAGVSNSANQYMGKLSVGLSW